MNFPRVLRFIVRHAYCFVFISTGSRCIQKDTKGWIRFKLYNISLKNVGKTIILLYS